MAERIRGEDATEDVDAFLKESRDSLHGKYWGPDSLAPVRLVDMRDEPPPAPVRTRPRIRPLDIVVGTVGLGAALLLVVFSLRDGKHETAKAPPAAQVRPRAPAVAARTPVVVGEVAPARIAAPPAIVEEPAASGPVESLPGAVPIVATMSVPESAPAEPVTSEQPAPAAASSATTDPAASAAPPQAPKKRRPKPATHAPPTASFPD